MRTALIDVLACPSCRGPLTGHGAASDRLVDGVVSCSRCSVAVPVVQGFPLFDESLLCGGSQDHAELVRSARARIRGREQYERFMQAKAERRLFDAYALFQPFNESLRALLAVIEPIRAQLSAGDLIIDTWCRTGWTGAWLASLFPEQTVLSLWEGDTDVLGYAGYVYWLGESARPDNWDIVFTHPDRPLPLASDVARFVHGYESLHRYRQDTLLAECRRIATEDGAILLSHVHLSNGEPDPWFERGCVQHHGRRYRAVLDRVLADTGQCGLVLGEATLFDCGGRIRLTDAPDTHDYNAAIFVGPATLANQWVTTEHERPIAAASRFIVNPLATFELEVGQLAVRGEALEGRVQHVLDRHPVYARRIRGLSALALTGRQPELIYYAMQAQTLEEIAASLQTDVDTLRHEAQPLVEHEVLWPAEVGRATARLQEHFRTLEVRPDGETSFAALWERLPAVYGDRPVLETEDGTAFTVEIVRELVDAVVAWLLVDTEVGDRIVIHAPNCPEAYVVLWACWLSARVAVPVEPDLPADAVSQIIERTAARLVLCDRHRATPRDVPTIVFDSLTPDVDATDLFSGAIAPYVEGDRVPRPQERAGADAAVLFTSGSTGRPKGVRLSLGALTSSGAAVARHFEWRCGDRLYSGGASYSMSGLRNPALAALWAGVTVVVPDPGPMHPLRVWTLLHDKAISVVATVPTQLATWVAVRQRVAGQPSPRALRSVAYTGHGISPALRQEVIEWLGVEATGYYGLTETCGFCLACPRGDVSAGNIGHPASALVQVVDDDGRPLPDGVRGELRVASPRLMSGYLETDTVSTVRKAGGWLYTGDAAVRMPDGSFELVGRLDDQVKDRFGDTVFPTEVEEAIATLPGVADRCCLAVRHAGGASSLVVFVVPANEALAAGLPDAVVAAVDRRLGTRKRPERVVVCDALPRKTSGKVDRAQLLAQCGIEG